MYAEAINGALRMYQRNWISVEWEQPWPGRIVGGPSKAPSELYMEYFHSPPWNGRKRLIRPCTM